MYVTGPLFVFIDDGQSKEKKTSRHTAQYHIALKEEKSKRNERRNKKTKIREESISALLIKL